MRKTLWTASVNSERKTIFVVLVAYIHITAQHLQKTIFVVLVAHIYITAQHLHKTWVLHQEIYAFSLLEATCKISFLLPGMEEGLLLYGCTAYVVVSAARFGNHSKQQTATVFFLGIVYIRAQYAPGSPQKNHFCIFLFFNTTCCRKIFRHFLHCSFTWNYQYPLQNFQGPFPLTYT